MTDPLYDKMVDELRKAGHDIQRPKKKQRGLGPKVVSEIARRFAPQIEQWLRTHAANEVEKATAPLLARIKELEEQLEHRA